MRASEVNDGRIMIGLRINNMADRYEKPNTVFCERVRRPDCGISRNKAHKYIEITWKLCPSELGKGVEKGMTTW